MVNSCCELELQRIISTQATERDSGVRRIFQDGYFLLCWVSTFFHNFSAEATIIKKKEKKKATVWRYLSICGTEFCFHFTVFHIVKNNGKA